MRLFEYKVTIKLILATNLCQGPREKKMIEKLIENTRVILIIDGKLSIYKKKVNKRIYKIT